MIKLKKREGKKEDFYFCPNIKKSDDRNKVLSVG